MTMPTASDPASAAPSSRVAVGYALGALGSILFATKGIAIKLAYAEGVDTETLLALRMLLSLPFYVGVGVLSVRGRQAGGAEALGRGSLRQIIWPYAGPGIWQFTYQIRKLIVLPASWPI